MNQNNSPPFSFELNNMNTAVNGADVFIRKIKQQFFRTTLLPVLLLSLAFAVLYPAGSFLYIRHVTKQKADHLSAVLDSSINDCIQAVLSDETLKSMEDFVSGRTDKLDIYRYLSSLFLSNALVSNFSLYQKEQMIMSNQDYLLSGGALSRVLDSVTKFQMDHLDGLYRLPHFENQLSGDRVVYTIGLRFSFPDSLDYYLLAEMRESNFLSICPDGSDIILTNAHNRVFFQKTDRAYVFPDGRCTSATLRNGLNHVFSEARIPDGTIRLFAVTSLVAEQYIMLIVLVLLVSATVISIILYRLMSRRINRSIYQSLASMFEAVDEFDKSHYNYRITVDPEDEIYPLIEQYNRILDMILNLIERNNAYADETRIAQIKAAQSQFSPHFLYNTLEAIRYTIAEDPKTAQKMIVKLSRLMRYSIDQPAASRPLLRDDMMYTKSYLDLQKLRMGSQLNYEIDMKEDAAGCHVPALFIQPLIENSIKYGIRFDRPLNIRIEAYMEDTRLVCIVADDGNGISAEELYSLRASLDQEDPDGHLGIYNTNKRLKLVYGDNYSITIDSETDRGFVVRIELEATE